MPPTNAQWLLYQQETVQGDAREKPGEAEGVGIKYNHVQNTFFQLPLTTPLSF